MFLTVLQLLQNVIEKIIYINKFIVKLVMQYMGTKIHNSKLRQEERITIERLPMLSCDETTFRINRGTQMNRKLLCWSLYA